jgi:hypothetical protein
MNNKRGQGMSTSTIVLLIIGLVVLVVLILGFTRGWSTLAPWLNSNNIDTVEKSCGVACSISGTYDFCTKTQKVNDGVNDKFEATCQELSINPSYSSYGIETCPDLC